MPADTIMPRILYYTVQEQDLNLQSCNVAAFLRGKGYSSHMLSLVRRSENGILLNHTRPFLTTPLHPGDLIRAEVPEDPVLQEKCLHLRSIEEDALLAKVRAGTDGFSGDPLPFAGVRILFEDEDILAVSKPAGIPTHPSKGYPFLTLSDLILMRAQISGCAFPVRCIDRLDRDTSGIVLIGKHLLSAAVLSRSMKNRQIGKTYLAIVRGHVRFPGIIREPIARMREDSVMRTVDPLRGEEAATAYRPASYRPDEDLTLMELHPMTGRTHQLRVHMKFIGCPIIGDFLYAKGDPGTSDIKRQALHAFRMEFIHPVTEKPVRITDPLPEDMNRLFRNVHV